MTTKSETAFTIVWPTATHKQVTIRFSEDLSVTYELLQNAKSKNRTAAADIVAPVSPTDDNKVSADVRKAARKAAANAMTNQVHRNEMQLGQSKSDKDETVTAHCTQVADHCEKCGITLSSADEIWKAVRLVVGQVEVSVLKAVVNRLIETILGPRPTDANPFDAQTRARAHFTAQRKGRERLHRTTPAPLRSGAR